MFLDHHGYGFQQIGSEVVTGIIGWPVFLFVLSPKRNSSLFAYIKQVPLLLRIAQPMLATAYLAH